MWYYSPALAIFNRISMPALELKEAAAQPVSPFLDLEGKRVL